MTSSETFLRASLCAALLATVASAAPAPGPVQFNRDIKPVLSDNCLACHGPDSGSRKAGLRLDTREGLFAKTKKDGPVITPGKPAASALWKRITTKDTDELMPPPESHKTLKPEQVAALKQWITEGAPWQSHWAFIKPERPPAPAVKNRRWGRNPIDGFILARLEEKGLAPAPEADRRTLARRLALDLTGLPPKPEDVEAFVNDKSADAYEMLVARLMATPQWGEHRARYWLDAARYADTHGLHFDNYREMWPYRDWVIRAFNNNLPFDRFTRDQIAGDLLENPTEDELVATGFHRCNPTTNEGGTIDEENLANYANDRVTTTSWVWLGLTANCAACHDHKFDPVTAKDFYSMAAFFRNTTQPAKDGNRKDSAPSMLIPQSDADRARWKTLPDEVTVAKGRVNERRKSAAPQQKEWLAGVKTTLFDASLNLTGLVAQAALNEGKGDEAAGVATNGAAKFKASGKLEWKKEGRLGPAAVVKKDATFVFGDVADFERDQPFSAGAWVKVADDKDGSVIGRMDAKNAFRGWDLYVDNREVVVHLVSKWPDDSLRVATTTKPLKAGEAAHVFFTHDGTAKAAGVRIYVNGVEVKHDGGKGGSGTKASVVGSIRTKELLRVGQRGGGLALEKAQIQDVRVYSRRVRTAEVKEIMTEGAARALASVAKPTDKQRDALYDYWLTKHDSTYTNLTAAVAGLEKEMEDIRGRNPVTHIQREKTNEMAMAYVLMRGQYDRQGEKVEPAGFSALHAYPKDAPKNRLGLAAWINAPENPLTARVTVNRFWQELFGTGLVRTSEDFGLVGDPPANQALLDWLAVEFQSSGWDVKKLFTLMVTSSAYRQSAAATPEKLAKDADNRLISRGPRFRMDAEMIRDYALGVSGLLKDKVGGASVKPYQPDGVWEAVAMRESNTRLYKRDTGDALYRRSLYTFWKRAAPPATMDIFNAPARENCAVRRERTNTPLQALATLNDPQFVEAARRLAENALAAANGDDTRALLEVARRVLLRPLKSQETAVLSAFHQRALAHYAADAEAAKQFIATGESKPDGQHPAAQLAALMLVANQVLNMDEVLNK